MAKTFDSLFIWQKSRELVNSIYSMMDGYRDWGFKDQIQRASVSIMNNIAEGFDSGSPAKFINFLNIAKGSCSEVRSMLFSVKICIYVPKKKGLNFSLSPNR